MWKLQGQVTNDDRRKRSACDTVHVRVLVVENSNAVYDMDIRVHVKLGYYCQFNRGELKTENQQSLWVMP
jgi:hypothetical protein